MRGAFCRALAAAACLSVGACQTAAVPGPGGVQVTAPSDAGMTCEQITAEVSKMDQMIAAGEAADTNRNLASAGAGAATQAAIMSGAGSSIPFIGTLANVATSATNMASESAKRDAENAKMRRLHLMGLHAGKNCKS